MAGDPFYKSRSWRRLRALVLSEEPFCRYCMEVGDTTLSTVVDHIIRRRERPDLALDRDNLAGCCEYCHNKHKQEVEHRGYWATMGHDGWPTDPSHPVNFSRDDQKK